MISNCWSHSRSNVTLDLSQIGTKISQLWTKMNYNCDVLVLYKTTDRTIQQSAADLLSGTDIHTKQKGGDIAQTNWRHAVSENEQAANNILPWWFVTEECRCSSSQLSAASSRKCGELLLMSRRYCPLLACCLMLEERSLFVAVWLLPSAKGFASGNSTDPLKSDEASAHRRSRRLACEKPFCPTLTTGSFTSDDVCFLGTGWFFDSEPRLPVASSAEFAAEPNSFAAPLFGQEVSGLRTLLSAPSWWWTECWLDCIGVSWTLATGTAEHFSSLCERDTKPSLCAGMVPTLGTCWVVECQKTRVR